jgi:putative ABC transport system permease protein
VSFLLGCLLSHYRRHPVQAVFLLVGVIMANVLLVGTQVINAQARASYAEGERFLGAGPLGRIRPADNRPLLDERQYIALRRAGFHELAPMLRQVVVLENGTTAELVGIDGLAMPRQAGQGAQRIAAEGNGSFAEVAGEDPAPAGGGDYASFSLPPYELWAAPTRLRQLGLSAGEQAVTTGGRKLPPAFATPGQSLGHRLLLDVGALQELADLRGSLSALLVFDITPERLDALVAALPPTLRWVPESDQPDPVALTRSFHLNLAAMGLLSFVVGVFLVYNALAFSYTDRRVLLRRLRLAGVERRRLARALLFELAVFLLLGALIGAWLGTLLAAWLLPGVGQTLAQLYGVYIQYPDGLAPGGLWPPLALTLVAGVLCAAFPLREALSAPLLDRGASGWDLGRTAHRDRRMALLGGALLVLAAALARWAPSVLPALAGMACLLLGAALLLPWVLRGLLNALQRLLPERHAALSWLVADSRWLLGPASLALMAMTLALVANNGLNTMVGSFRTATDQWLAQRLTAELYLRESQDTAELQQWLDEQAPGARVAERHRATLQRQAPAGGPVTVEVVDLPLVGDFMNSIDLLQGAPDAMMTFADGRGVLISERAMRLDGWALGDAVTLCERRGALPVVGVFHDYGNPLSQWMVAPALHRDCWPGREPSGQAIHGISDGPDGDATAMTDSIDWPGVALALTEAFDLEDGDVVDQRELRRIALGVFDRTFSVTRALNLLTLIVAGVGIFCAVSAIHHHRVGQQALLASLGLSRRARGALLLLQWGLLGALSMALVWPFGALLAGYLAGVVTPAAFGWSFPLVVQAGPFLSLAGVAVLCLILAVALPSFKLLSARPGDLLRWQSV